MENLKKLINPKEDRKGEIEKQKTQMGMVENKLKSKIVDLNPTISINYFTCK